MTDDILCRLVRRWGGVAYTEYCKIDNFIESLRLPKDLSMVLFETEECCHTFFKNFYARNKRVIFDLLDFRDYKIKTNKKTLAQFEEECYDNGVKQAFQSTFYQPINSDDAEKIVDCIARSKTSLDEIFNRFNENTDENILRNLL